MSDEVQLIIAGSVLLFERSGHIFSKEDGLLSSLRGFADRLERHVIVKKNADKVIFLLFYFFNSQIWDLYRDTDQCIC